MTKEQKKISYHNYKIAKKYFNLQKGYVLHHKDPTWLKEDIERYIQWNIEDLEVMTKGDHRRWHMAYDVAMGDTKKYGHEFTQEEREHLSKVLKGRPSPNKGNTFKKSPEAIEKTRQAHIGKKRSPETCEKISEAAKRRKPTKGNTNMHWYNNGVEEICAYECPSGFVKGRLKREHRGKQSDSDKAD